MAAGHVHDLSSTCDDAREFQSDQFYKNPCHHVHTKSVHLAGQPVMDLLGSGSCLVIVLGWLAKRVSKIRGWTGIKNEPGLIGCRAQDKLTTTTTVQELAVAPSIVYAMPLSNS